jgi:hypothetical protein
MATAKPTKKTAAKAATKAAPTKGTKKTAPCGKGSCS